MRAQTQVKAGANGKGTNKAASDASGKAGLL